VSPADPTRCVVALGAPSCYPWNARSEQHGARLAVAAFSWFLYDVYAYSVSIFSPTILEDVFDSAEVCDDAWSRAAVVSVVASSRTKIVGSSSRLFRGCRTHERSPR
jgi:hypothetical protein